MMYIQLDSNSRRILPSDSQSNYGLALALLILSELFRLNGWVTRKDKCIAIVNHTANETENFRAYKE